MKNSCQQADGFGVAEDNELPAFFGDLEAASVDFGHEALGAAKAFDIASLAPDDATLLDLFGGEDVVQPEVGVEGGVVCLHLRSLGEGWLILDLPPFR